MASEDGPCSTACVDVAVQEGDPVKKTEAACGCLEDEEDAAGCTAAGKEAEEDESVASDGSGEDDETTATVAVEKEAEVAAADDDDDESVDSDAEYDSQMSSLEYILTYKALPQYEIDLLLESPLERTPFTETELFKALSTDPSTSLEDIAAGAAEHEDRLDTRVRFQEWVRSEYETKGYVVVSDEYIARRVQVEEFTRKLWEEGFARLDHDDESDDEQEVEEGTVNI